MKKILGIAAAAIAVGTMGVGAAKAAWDQSTQQKTVNVLIGTSSDITSANITGGDVTKSLVPTGAIVGSNDVTELDLGTLTITASDKVDFVICTTTVYANGVDVTNLFSVFDEDIDRSGDTFETLDLRLSFKNDASTISSADVLKVKGKTLTVSIQLTAQAK